jgi:membrane protein YdbS with pleckstrin-like domain
MAKIETNLDPAAPDFVPTQRIATTTIIDGPPAAPEPVLAPPVVPGVTGPGVAAPTGAAAADPATGIGVEGEETVWEDSYSMRNFIGRLVLRVVLTIAWLGLALETWANGHRNLAPVSVVTGLVLLALWLVLLVRMAQARYGHFYRLTNRRLFVSTGLLRRRRDQMELLSVKDVYTRQTFLERTLSLGTVVVVSSEKELPVFYITGVQDPKQVMDLIWHHARAERDIRSAKVQEV